MRLLSRTRARGGSETETTRPEETRENLHPRPFFRASDGPCLRASISWRIYQATPVAGRRHDSARLSIQGVGIFGNGPVAEWYDPFVSGEELRDRHEMDPALTYLQKLDEETMTRGWGPGKTPEDRRRIVAAALIFGRQFDERMRDTPPESIEEKDFQRFLMALMNAVIREFAEREGMDSAEAGAFLSDVGTRDYVLEFNEVLEEAAEDPEKSLNEHFKAAIEARQDRAVWSRHFSSG